MDRIIIPVTAISAYLYCKRKLFLESVLKIIEPPKKAMVNGSIRHQAYDEINKIEETVVKSIRADSASATEVLRLYIREYSRVLKQVVMKNKHKLRSAGLPLTDAYSQNWKFLASEAETRAANIISFIEKERFFGAELWEKLVPKIHSELRVVSQGLGLKGVIDRIEDYGTYNIPIELKTGKMPKDGVWPGHRVQIAAYMLMLSEKLNANISTGIIKYLDQNEAREVRMNPFLKEEVEKLAADTRGVLTGKTLPDFADNENKCKACGIREICHNKGLLERKTIILTLA